PAAHLVNWNELVRVARTPECGGNAGIERPADRQVDDPLAKALLRQAIQPFHGSKVLREARLLEFRIGAAQVVAVERAVRPHASGEETAAERAISEGRNLVL